MPLEVSRLVSKRTNGKHVWEKFFFLCMFLVIYLFFRVWVRPRGAVK